MSDKDDRAAELEKLKEERWGKPADLDKERVEKK